MVTKNFAKPTQIAPVAGLDGACLAHLVESGCISRGDYRQLFEQRKSDAAIFSRVKVKPGKE